MVTVLTIEGDLDASNFQDAINKAQEIYDSGERNLVVDMSAVNFMSSSGLVALHSIALLMQGEETPDLQAGWGAIHAVARDRDSGKQSNLKLVNPQPKVMATLEITGMDEFFEIFGDLDAALDSF